MALAEPKCRTLEHSQGVPQTRRRPPCRRRRVVQFMGQSRREFAQRGHFLPLLCQCVRFRATQGHDGQNAAGNRRAGFHHVLKSFRRDLENARRPDGSACGNGSLMGEHRKRPGELPRFMHGQQGVFPATLRVTFSSPSKTTKKSCSSWPS